MATKSYTDIEQSKKLAEILPIESADMFYNEEPEDETYPKDIVDTEYPMVLRKEQKRFLEEYGIPCWSLAALLAILPEINGVPLKIEKVKAEDGYDGYYYHIEYESIVLIPYSKNPVDACYEMIIKLKELNLL